MVFPALGIDSTSGREIQMWERKKVYLLTSNGDRFIQKVELRRFNAADRRSNREPIEAQRSLTASFLRDHSAFESFNQPNPKGCSSQ
jgi:hypothetical protein